ncbi:hypothetical protein COCOBI_03-7050 [Coccomyxa sp. Obi]|nr:hypothetical protein COCOBI_03-7050 [Coccomyxa sp. Obi]
MLREKRLGRVRNNVFDRMCRFLSTVLPPDNLFPPSLHVMQGLVECPEPSKYEHHVCKQDHCRFQYAPKHEWWKHAEDKCPTCGEPRFKRKTSASGGLILTPQKAFWYFPIKEVIQNKFFNNTKWTQLRRSDMEWAAQDPCNFFGAGEARRLNALFDGKLMHPHSGCYELGMDWVQVFNITMHSVGVIGIRSTDIPIEHRGNREFSDVLLIIPGPNEPHNLDIFLEPLLEDLRSCGPLGDGFKVSEHKMVDGLQEIVEFMHTVFLVKWHVDRPALGALLKASSVAAYMACCWCLFQSTRVGNGMYPLGYSHPEPQTLLHKDTDPPMPPPSKYMHDDSLKLSHDQHMHVAGEAEAGRFSAKKAGCRGVSPVFKMLPYADRNNLCLVPAAHGFLHGLVKGLWEKILYKGKRTEDVAWYTLSDEKRAILRQRGREIRTTSEFGRGYKCVVDQRGGYTMEDWLHFTETFSPLLRHGDILHEQVAEMWELLRGAVLFYMRACTPEELQPANRRAAREKLIQYGRLLQGTPRLLNGDEDPNLLRMPLSMCTPNLHMLVCRLFEQEAAQGCTAHNLEFWLERLMQLVKENLKYRICMCPERLFISDHCLDLALDNCSRQPGIRSFDEWCPSYRSLPLRGNKEDMDEGDEEGRQMIGVGKAIRRGDQSAVHEVAASFLRRLRPAGWALENLSPNCSNIRRFFQADIPLVGSVNAADYSRAKSRVSYYVLYRLAVGRQGNEREEHRVAKVKEFLMLRPAEDQADADLLRLAVCDVIAGVPR